MEKELLALLNAERLGYPFPASIIYQSKTVGAGESDIVVWDMDMHDKGIAMHPYYVGVITSVANNWFANTYLEWTIDYTERVIEPSRVMNRRVEYSLGALNNPTEIKPGYVITNESRWLATNNDTSDHTFYVYITGYFVLKKVFEMFCNLALEQP